MHKIMSRMMQVDEEFGLDRLIEVETDDELDQAERDWEEDEDIAESDCTAPSRYSSINAVIDSTIPWPQSFRQSMDMYTSVASPPVSFLKGGTLLTSTSKKADVSICQPSSLIKPLISGTSLKNEEVPTSTVPLTSSATSPCTLSELPTPPLCSYGQSILNALNVLCGIGILSVPYALKEGGWFSLFILVLFAIITCYTGILLKNCLESSPDLRTYPDIGYAAFGAVGRIFIAAVLYAELYSSCVEYLIMMSDNLSVLFPNAHIYIAGFHLESYQICAIVSTIVILPTVCLRNLTLLSYISAGGVLTLAAVVLCLLWVGIVDGVGFNHSGGKSLDIANLPVTIGLIGFCYGGHSVFPNIYSSMKEPSKFPRVLVISFLVSFVLYMGVAVCGFLMFGDSTKSQFTLNMPSQFPASDIAAWTVVIAPVTKYALTITPVAFGLEELLPSAQHRTYGVSIIIRTLLVISTLIVALIVPFFGSVMALIGSLLVMLVAIIFPCACYLRIHHGQLTKFQIAVCSSIIIVGLVSAIMGTYSALTSIADQRKY